MLKETEKGAQQSTPSFQSTSSGKETSFANEMLGAQL